MKHLLRYLPLPLSVCDADGRLVAFNHHAELLWGRKPTLMIPFDDRSSGEFCAPVSEWLEVLRKGADNDTEIRPLTASTGAEFMPSLTQSPPERRLVRIRDLKNDQLIRVTIVAFTDGTDDSVPGPDASSLWIWEGGAEQILESQEADAAERLKLLNEALQFGTWERDLSSQALHWSAGQERMMGFEPGTFPGTYADFLALVHPESLAALRAAQKKALETDGRYQAELKFQLRDGRVRWGQTRGQILFDKHGHPSRIVGVEFDITERKQAELALHEAQEWSTKVAATLPGAIFSFRVRSDGTAEFPYCSPAIYELSGLTPERLCADARRMIDVLHPEDLVRLKQSVQVSRETLEIWQEEFRLRHPQKGEIWVEARSIPQTEPDGGTLWVGILLDVTERIRAAEALRSSEELYRRLLHVIPNAVFIATAGVITYCNRSMLTLVGGIEAEQLLGRELLELFEPSGHAAIQSRIVRLCETSEPVEQIEETIYRLDGQTIPVEVVATSISYGGQPSILFAIHDLSTRRRIEEELRHAQKMEAVGRLAGGVAHDFNNLLTVILGYSEIVLRTVPASNSMHELVSEIHAAGQRAAGLTRQLLTFSRRQVMKPIIVNLNHIVLEELAMLRRVIGEDIAIITRTYPHPLSVRVDPFQMHQVLMNIVVNSRDAMPCGGKLLISTERVCVTESSGGNASEYRAGEYARLSITDTGCGISDEIKPRIFDPFFTTKDPGKGSGLGLSVVHGIVKQSDGYVEISSQTGISTTVNILLPVSTEETLPGSGASISRESVQGVETILLVEDEESVRQIALMALSAAGYTVLSARNGTEALRICRHQDGKVDLLVTDVVLPTISGRNLAEVIRDRYPEIKVLFMSGYTDDAVVRHGVLRQEVDFLQKPYTPDALCHRVRSVLDAD